MPIIMPKLTNSTLITASLVLALMSAPCLAQTVQNQRSFVSTAGNDSNSCIDPANACRSFRGALPKTAPGGEIDALDGGGFDFDSLTISQSVTIDGGAGHVASITVYTAPHDAIDILPPAKVVVLRNLSLNGGGGIGLNGIRYTAGAALHLENVRILGFSNHAVDFEPTANAKLQINNAVVTDNAQYGIFVKPATGVSAAATLIGLTSSRNKFGLVIQGNAGAVVQDSAMTDNSNASVFVAATKTTIERSVIARNGKGVVTFGTLASVFLSQTGIFLNGTGIDTSGGGQVISFGNNQLGGNAVDGAPTSTIAQK